MKNKKTRKIFVAGNRSDYGYANWLQSNGIVNDIHKADLVLGLGGSDISPHYYNQPDSGLLHCCPGIDKQEYEDYKRAIELGKKIVGTCKGAQWAAVLAGGALFQDIHHPYYHTVTTFDGRKMECNSLHHNMADLSKLKEGEDYRLLAWTEGLSPHHINGYRENVPCHKEPEVVFYPKINFLGFQNHNEMMFRRNKELDFIQWSRGLLNNLMESKL